MSPRRRTLAFLFSLCVVALLSSCTTFYDVQYAPAPLEVKLEDSAQPELSGRALISVTGLRRADRSADRPAQFELAMRLENLGSVPFTVESESLELVTANLQSVGSAQVSPSPVPSVEPGQTAQLELVFPIRDARGVDAFDLSGVNLRFALRYADRRMVMGANFQRVVPNRSYYYYDSGFYWGPSWRWHSHVGRFCAY